MSDCLHENQHVETDEDNYGHAYRLYVCDDCGEDLPGDPDMDAAEYAAEAAIDMARGK